MTREALLEPIISSVRKGTALSRYTILDYFADWDVLPFDFDGQHVWTMVAKGTEVHFALAPGWKPKASMRGAVRSFLKPVIERHGFLTTRIAHGRAAQKEFVKRIGFKPTWKDGDVEYYLLGSLPFERKL
jgi:hypothetical protein